MCKRLVELLKHNSWRVVKPALRTIGNVVCAEDDLDYTEAILEAGSVACLKKLIAHPNREIQKEVGMGFVAVDVATADTMAVLTLSFVCFFICARLGCLIGI